MGKVVCGLCLCPHLFYPVLALPEPICALLLLGTCIPLHPAVSMSSWASWDPLLQHKELQAPTSPQILALQPSLRARHWDQVGFSQLSGSQVWRSPHCSLLGINCWGGGRGGVEVRTAPSHLTAGTILWMLPRPPLSPGELSFAPGRQQVTSCFPEISFLTFQEGGKGLRASAHTSALIQWLPAAPGPRGL